MHFNNIKLNKTKIILMLRSAETSIPNKKNPWPQSASELYRPSDRRLSAKLVPTFCG
jgi:hypothetical protein